MAVTSVHAERGSTDSSARPEDGPGSVPLSVAYVLHIFPVLSETFIAIELLELQKLGVQPSILVWDTPEGNPEYCLTTRQHAFVRELMPRVEYLRARRTPRAEVIQANYSLLTTRGALSYLEAYRLARRYRLVGDWRSFLRFAVWGWELRRRGVACLHSHFGTEAAAVSHTLSQLSGLPFSFTTHAHDIYSMPQWLPEKIQAARFVVTVCEANRGHLLSVSPNAPRDRIRVVHSGIDTDLFAPKPRAHASRFIILSVGRLVETKGHADLVSACRLLLQQGLDFECLIIGDGPCRADLERMIEESGLDNHVRLLGSLPREQLVPLLDLAAVFVLPCFVDRESGNRDAIPMVLMEAMCKEIPVVATPVTGIPELVRDRSGVLVPERDVVALARAIQDIHEASAEQRSAMGRAGRRIVEREFNLKVQTRRLVELFREGLPDRRSARGLD